MFQVLFSNVRERQTAVLSRRNGRVFKERSRCGVEWGGSDRGGNRCCDHRRGPQHRGSHGAQRIHHEGASLVIRTSGAACQDACHVNFVFEPHSMVLLLRRWRIWSWQSKGVLRSASERLLVLENAHQDEKLSRFRLFMQTMFCVLRCKFVNVVHKWDIYLVNREDICSFPQKSWPHSAFVQVNVFMRTDGPRAAEKQPRFHHNQTHQADFWVLVRVSCALQIGNSNRNSEIGLVCFGLTHKSFTRQWGTDILSCTAQRLESCRSSHGSCFHVEHCFGIQHKKSQLSGLFALKAIWRHAFHCVPAQDATSVGVSCTCWCWLGTENGLDWHHAQQRVVFSSCTQIGVMHITVRNDWKIKSHLVIFREQ